MDDGLDATPNDDAEVMGDAFALANEMDVVDSGSLDSLDISGEAMSNWGLLALFCCRLPLDSARLLAADC